ncbi:MAG: transketolase C-terminal domain-containing protein, partial [Deltaproteobacteria bacterium]
VAKTHRALIVHEAPKTGGVGGEVAALIAEKRFTALNSPIIRVGAPFTPLPRHPYEKLYLPNKEKIAGAVKEIFR